jgi:hypothetical protein
MKTIYRIALCLSVAAVATTGCKKIDRLPETEFTDANFWNTEADLMNAANRLYQQLPGDWIDNRADDAVNTSPNAVSTGNRSVPNTSGDWTDRYSEIFTANNILEKGGKNLWRKQCQPDTGAQPLPQFGKRPVGTYPQPVTPIPV